MKRIFSVAVVIASLFVQLLPLHAQIGPGLIAGKVIGPSGGVPGITVQVINADGAIVGRAVTTAMGTFRIEGAGVGAFIVQAVRSTGDVIGTSMVTLTPELMTATDVVIRLADEDAAAAAARARARAAAIVAALAAVRGIVMVIGNKPDASPTR